MDTDNFIIHIKTEELYENIAGDVEKRFDKSKSKFHRPLPKEIMKTWLENNFFGQILIKLRLW